MERLIGTVSRGLRAPIIRQGDDIVEIVANSVLQAAQQGGFAIGDRDVIAVTEAVVARAQGNYATTSQIAQDVQNKFGDHTLGGDLSDFKPQPLCNLLKRYRQGREENGADAEFPSRRSGQPSGGLGYFG